MSNTSKVEPDFLEKTLLEPISKLTQHPLTESTTEKEVKSAYKKLAMRHHPDKGGKQAKFVEVTEAKNKCLAWIAKRN